MFVLSPQFRVWWTVIAIVFILIVQVGNLSWLLKFQPDSTNVNYEVIKEVNTVNPNNYRATKTQTQETISGVKYSKWKIQKSYPTLVSKQGSPRIAVILLYFGKTLPAWFKMFCFTTISSAELVDWFIFITEAPNVAVPDNVRLIRISKKEMFQRLAWQLDANYSSTIAGKATLETYFHYFLEKFPYSMVEYKPALGHLFADYITAYSHWAYADLDLLMGRMHVQLSTEELTKYDVITLTFGDNNRLYMRGQMTVHKNKLSVNSLWKECAYLSHIGTRMENYFVEGGNWRFQSAEGCYSKVVADNPNISVLYAPIQFSDAFAGSIDQKETILIGGSLLRCYEYPIDNEVLQLASGQIRHHKDSDGGLYSSPSGSMPLDRIADQPKCSYWIEPAHQVCTRFVAANASIILQNAELRKFSGNVLYPFFSCPLHVPKLICVGNLSIFCVSFRCQVLTQTLSRSFHCPFSR
jgi:hypothetical protein